MRSVTTAAAGIVSAVALAAVVSLTAWADSTAGAVDHAALMARADTIAAEVAELRGLKVKRPIKRGVMSKDQIRERLLERIADEYTDAELRRQALAMKRFGMLAPDVDYKKLVVEILTDQIAGFYDPKTRELYLAGWQSGGVDAMNQDLVMAHEIAHALQDQHFGLAAFMKLDKKNGDASVARQAVVEGDGTALMFEYAMRGTGVKVSPWGNDQVLEMIEPSVSGGMATGPLATAPLVIKEGLIFPYLGGLKFVVHFRRHHPWSRIDEIYKKPPLSTEHILHPKKYQRYERPDEISAKPVPSLKGYELIHDNVNGELGLSVLLRQHGIAAQKRGRAPSRAELAAEGWGGDRVAVYAPKGHDGALAGTIGVMYTTWDDESEAIEFAETLPDVLESLAGKGAKAVEKDGLVAGYGAGGLMFTAERKKDAVVVLVGAPEAMEATLRGEIWKHWKVRRR